MCSVFSMNKPTQTEVLATSLHTRATEVRERFLRRHGKIWRKHGKEKRTD